MQLTTVTDKSGKAGRVVLLNEKTAVLEYQQEHYRVPLALLEENDDSYTLKSGSWQDLREYRAEVPADLLRAADAARASGAPAQTWEAEKLVEQTTIPIVEETIIVSKRERVTPVRVHTEVVTELETIEVPLESTEVVIEHVAVNEVVTEIPKVRTENGVTIIPVIEERLVTYKEFVLKEEVHIKTVRHEEMQQEQMELRKERLVVERDDQPSEEVERM